MTSGSAREPLPGLTRVASRAYEEALRSATGACDPHTLEPSELDELLTAGYGLIVPGPPRLFVPIPPEIAIGRATANALHNWLASAPDLDLVERELRRLGKSAQPIIGHGQTTQSGHQFLVVADDQSRAVYTEAMRNARRIHRSMQPYPTWHVPDYVEDPSTTTHTPDDGLGKGVRQQYLYDTKILEIPWFFKEALDELEHGVEARVAQGTLPTQMTLIDGQVAMIACDPNHPVMLYTTAPLIVAALELLFDQCWERAVTLTPEPNEATWSGLDDTDRGVLRLLVQGEKNESIARVLGISPRTVSRSIHRLQAAYSVGTRTALIAVAVQQAPSAAVSQPHEP